MKYWKALLVGVVQGVTEFLPVSSSGHLSILAKLSVMPTSIFYNLSLHLATLLAVLIVMRREIVELLRHPIRGDAKYILLATPFTVGIALIFKEFFPDLLTGSLLGFGFLLTSALLFASEKLCRERVGRMPSVKVSILTGIFQGIAVLPGVSRSGSTIAAARYMGLSRERAARFSFLLSIPVILGGFLLEGVESGFSAAGADMTEILVAATAAFLSGLLAMRFMLGKMKKGLMPFVPYTFLVGVLCYFLP